MIPRPEVRFRPLLIGAMLLVGVTVSSARSARAACGDWLAHPGSSSQTVDSNLEDAPSPASPHKPCDGPGCRENRMPLSFPVRVPLTQVRISDFAIDTVSVSTGDADCASCRVELVAAPRDGFRLRVERPPCH